MSGESIEDLRIDLVKLSDAQIKSKFDFTAGNRTVEDELRKVIQP